MGVGCLLLAHAQIPVNHHAAKSRLRDYVLQPDWSNISELKSCQATAVNTIEHARVLYHSAQGGQLK